LDLQQGDVLFYPEKSEDADCSGPSCVYVWSCNNTIVHADVILNNSQFSWSEIGNDGDVINIKSEIIKALGYVVGLGHCQTGDSIADCAGRTGTDPSSDSVMYKFPQIGKKTTITEDERQGMLLDQGIMSAYFMKEEVDLGYVQLDRNFLDYAIQNHLELRKLTIDALEGK
jgi:hypothetical protein